jgi:hypothetical protein
LSKNQEELKKILGEDYGKDWKGYTWWS